MRNIVIFLIFFNYGQAFAQEKITFLKGSLILPKEVIKNPSYDTLPPRHVEDQLDYSPKFSEFLYGEQYLNVQYFEMERKDDFLNALIEGRENRIKRLGLSKNETSTRELKSSKGNRSVIFGDFTSTSNANFYFFYVINKTSTVGVSGELKFLTKDKREAKRKVIKLINSVKFN